MMPGQAVLSVRQLADQLKANGHHCPEVTAETVERDYQRNLRFLRESELTKNLNMDLPRHFGPIDVGTDVWVRPEQLVTLACRRDAFQRPAERQNYYVTRFDSVTRDWSLAGDSRFEFWPYDILPAEEQLYHPPYGFVDGPMRWLLQRWQNDSLLYLWPFRRGPSATSAWCFYAGQRLADFRSVREFAKKRLPSANRFAFAVDAQSPDGIELLCAIGTGVADSTDDFYVADIRFQYVYHLHHHELVMISCSTPEAQALLVSELVAESDLFEDASGFPDEEG